MTNLHLFTPRNSPQAQQAADVAEATAMRRYAIKKARVDAVKWQREHARQTERLIATFERVAVALERLHEDGGAR